MTDTTFSSANQPTSTERKTRTIDQEIEALEDKLARKKALRREQRNQQKYIIGGMMLALAHKDENVKRKLMADLKANVTRPADIKTIAPLLAELTT